jgi:acetyl-CoA C-acetyltransferase
VIIGVAQWTGRRDALPDAEPLAQWERVCRGAIEDAGLPPSTAQQVEALMLTDCMSWRYDDPVARLAERLGTEAKIGKISAPSGTAGQTMVNNAATLVRNGEVDVALVCGGEALGSVRAYRKAGAVPPWSHVHPEGPAHHFDLEAHQHPGESAVGLTEGVGAVYGFAMRDVARRAHLGIAPDQYRKDLGETLSGLTKVAATNPYAWFPQERDAQFLITPTADNRMVSYPYTKHMVAIIDVDMFAGLLVTSEEWADAHDVPRDRRVYPWTYCYAEDPVYIAPRDKLWKSDAMAAASKAALDAAGLTIDDIQYIDLYSCFTAAVNFGRDALGISDRPAEELTVTGGLPYGGGPGSSYVLTSLARMVGKLRADPGSKGLISGLGMLMSNHNYGIYSSAPPSADIRQPDMAAVQASVDAIPQRAIADDYAGEAVVATYTVAHDRGGAPSSGAFICDLPSNARCYALMRDPALLAEAERSELVGRRVMIAAGEKVGEIVSLLG